MNSIRPQYHIRKTSTGLDAWDVRRLIRLSAGFPLVEINPNEIAELDQNHWYSGPGAEPTPRSIIDHVRLIEECDTNYPIILDETGRLMDGMHRVCKAVMVGVESIPAVQFVEDPPPDYIDCDPRELPYD